MDTSDITVQILRGIRDEIRATNTRLDTTNQRLETTNQRLESLEQCVEHMDGRLVGMESAITAFLSRCEHDIAELKQRLDEPRR